MPCPDAIKISGAPLWPLGGKELRDLSTGRAFWAALGIVIFLTGYSYIQAASLYTEASRSAQKFPELARNLSPLDGILVPTFGALYLAATFLFPFIVIRTVGAEKQSGAQKMLIQLPYSMFALLTAKLAAAVVAWAVMLLPSLSALGLWGLSGGHLSGVEIANLVLGHFLYALVIGGISLVAAAVTESPASATVAAVGFTLGFWVLDFAAAGDNELIKNLAGLSLTAVLRTFERGVFSLNVLAGSLLAVLGLAGIAGIWFHSGHTISRRLRRSALVVIAAAITLALTVQVHFFRDAAEDRRNSFSPAVEIALKTIKGRLNIEVHLAPEDPRLYDLERSLLSKFRRTMGNVEITFANARRSRWLSNNGDQYGQVYYRYGGQQAASRSTSEEEVLPLVFEIAGLNQSLSAGNMVFPGYPLVTEVRWARIWFYILFPLIVLFFWGWIYGKFFTLKNIPWFKSSTKGESL
ncbi:MAG: ABC transporter permease [Deltaproteobacteria bacterium]|nr:ABC transporter permease [Deltaproteobacteria bacterium]